MARENNDFEYFKNTILTKEEFNKRIGDEKKKSILATIFIIHGYIESILLDWFNYCGNQKPKQISDDVLNGIERIGFLNFIQLHLVMGNIPQGLFARMKKFNLARNNLAHYIRDINLDSKKTQNGLERNMKEEVKIYLDLFKIYEDMLDKQANKLLP